MSEPQEGHSSKRSKELTFDDQEVMGDLAECVVEVLNQEIQKEVEPFESYSHLLRMRLQKDPKIFREHFVQGYEVLLETLHSMPQT